MTNFITNIREKIALFKQEKQLRKVPRKKGIYNLSTAQTAGILYDATIEANHLIVRNFIKELRSHDIKIQALGYIDKKKREDNYIGDSTYTFTCKTDFNFFYSIKKEAINEFINTPFNLLIILTNKPSFAIDYLGRFSKAEFKVGKSGLDNELYDLMIELKENDDIDELKKQILHYLNILNNN